jgi:hypothetical protein
VASHRQCNVAATKTEYPRPWEIAGDALRPGSAEIVGAIHAACRAPNDSKPLVAVSSPAIMRLHVNIALMPRSSIGAGDL